MRSTRHYSITSHLPFSNPTSDSCRQTQHTHLQWRRESTARDEVKKGGEGENTIPEHTVQDEYNRRVNNKIIEREREW
jgi:hypothetical protein